ncbi:MAG: (2Fe-2S) ferredoxin domain-containing protein [Bacteroidota bacterium]
MSRFQRHVFVCINERPGHDPKGCCLLKGSAEVRDMLKDELKKRGLARYIRANNAGCLDACEFGVSLVIYPEGIWYGGVKKEDIPEIIERTLLKGEVIERLLINDPRYKTDTMQFTPLQLP